MQRANALQQSPDLFRKLAQLSVAADESSLGEVALDLVRIRASQINGCSFCLDLHVKQAKMHGESELRLHHVSVWREFKLFTPRERAALGWTEILTILPTQGIPDEIYGRVREHLTEQELVKLTYAIMAINGWNRLNVAFKTPPGSADTLLGLGGAGSN